MIRKIGIFIVLLPLYGFNYLIDLLSLLSMKFKRIVSDYQLHYSNNIISKVNHTSCGGKKIEMQFYTPNTMCFYRADSFSNKEPETLEWIEEFGRGEATMFDIGANVGIYSIYHNKLNGGKCFAFEPSFFNLKLLLKNINLNDCQDITSVVSNPLFSSIGFSEFKYSNNIEGGSGLAFGVDYGGSGEEMSVQSSSRVLGFSLDWMVDNKIVKVPNFIKIDVDGIEHIILEGAKKVLAHPDCKSILVEVNDDFVEQSNKVSILLTDCGYILRDKKQWGRTVLPSDTVQGTCNQIWVKKCKLSNENI